MSAAAIEVLDRLAHDRPLPADLVQDIDVIELAKMIGSFATWPAIPGAANVIRRARLPSLIPARVSIDGYRGGRDMPPCLFALAVIREDEQLLDLAARVHPIALALLALVILETPAHPDPETLLELYALAERGDF